jgi:hypothetical protein
MFGYRIASTSQYECNRSRYIKAVLTITTGTTDIDQVIRAQVNRSRKLEERLRESIQQIYTHSSYPERCQDRGYLSKRKLIAYHHVHQGTTLVNREPLPVKNSFDT